MNSLQPIRIVTFVVNICGEEDKQYGVARITETETVTFSIKDTIWSDKKLPQKGDLVVLDCLIQSPMRAYSARLANEEEKKEILKPIETFREINSRIGGRKC